MTRAERRRRTECKIKQRLHLAVKFGWQGGTMYERHVEKVKHSGGYMRDGNVTHYVACGWRRYYRRENKKVVW